MPGIHLYSSNKLEILADKFAQLLESRPLPPLQKEIILVQSRGMARWLAMETATRLNIWANCDCPFPNTFVRNIYQLLLPGLPEVSVFNKEFNLWHLMDILSEVRDEPHFSKVTVYLKSGDELKLFQLAREIADLFDQYTIFRPQMILGWEEALPKVQNDHLWQSILWIRLVKRLQQLQSIPDQHRARLLQLFEEKLLDPDFNAAVLPPRISVFGISSLPPYHLRVLAALAQYTDLHFFIMNPCMEYWFDIIADRDIAKISHHEGTAAETLHLERGNSLLASMGHLGQDFMAMLQELNADEQELFDLSGNDSLLSRIQQDILQLRENSGSAERSSHFSQLIDENDTSITFHSCHSPMREVEILHDQLLSVFDTAHTDSPIEPRDILVMAPEIEEYAPLIRAVFDADSATSPPIPYSISDQSIRRTSRYIESFLKILILPQSRLSSIEVMGILEAESVKNRFSMTDADLVVLENWVRETNICWGIDQEHKIRLQLPPSPENTWRSGLERLLLGYAMPGYEQSLFENILPYDHIEGDNSELLGKFLDFTASIFSFSEKLDQRYTLAEWSEILLQVQNDLLFADETTEPEERILQRLLFDLRQLQDQTSYLKKVSLEVIRSYLINVLEERFSPLAGESGFLAGGVTFCSMLPMRAIPFKIVYLLGMNDGAYPRSGRKRSFDLMARKPKRGDRSKRYDDRYLFLETILSARRKLSISFIGQSIQDGAKRPPSVLVSELMDYIDNNFTQSADRNQHRISLSNKITTLHHLQPYHPGYFQPQNLSSGDTFFSYSAENREAAMALQTRQQRITSLFSATLTPPPETSKNIHLQELISFFSHPIRFILLKRIGIAPIEEKQALATTEPFDLKGLSRYKLENSILDHLLKHRDCNRLYLIKKAAGELPHGRLGKLYFIQLVSKLKPFHKMLAELLEGVEIEEQQIELAVGDYRITGSLENARSKGLVQYRYANMTSKDVIRSWISHLVLTSFMESHSAAQNTFTFFVGKDGIYKYNSTLRGGHYLADLLDLYWQGLCRPLPFFPNTSYAFAREIHKGNSEQGALMKAVSEWEGNRFNLSGEKKDPYNQLCCKYFMLAENRLFRDAAKKIYLPALEYQEKITPENFRAATKIR
jgi:exodeoxyribonuclease V gamma subunit